MASHDGRMNVDGWNLQAPAEKRKQDARELHKLEERSNLKERGRVDDGSSEH